MLMISSEEVREVSRGTSDNQHPHPLKLDVSVGAKQDFVTSGELLGTRFDVTSKHWKMKCIYASFTLMRTHDKAPFIDEIRVGSCHLHNVEAKKYDVASSCCTVLLNDADTYNLDIIGVDLNGASYEHPNHPGEDSSVLKAMKDHMGPLRMPVELLGINGAGGRFIISPTVGCGSFPPIPTRVDTERAAHVQDCLLQATVFSAHLARLQPGSAKA